MNGLQVFANPDFGEIRTVEKLEAACETLREVSQ